MTQEQPLYGELVIPFNAEEPSDTHEEAMAKAKEMRSMIEMVAYHLAEKRGFAPGHELDDWLKAEIEVLRTLK